MPGFHYWPGAPDDVSYLANMHRHLFLIIVGWKVALDNNRSVEFHTAQGWIKKLYTDPQNFGPKSCEMIAKDLGTLLVANGHPQPSFIEVWEDGENGSKVEFA